MTRLENDMVTRLSFQTYGIKLFGMVYIKYSRQTLYESIYLNLGRNKQTLIKKKIVRNIGFVSI